jgi:hypothetical protein
MGKVLAVTESIIDEIEALTPGAFALPGGKVVTLGRQASWATATTGNTVVSAGSIEARRALSAINSRAFVLDLMEHVSPELPSNASATEAQKMAVFSRRKWWAWQGLNLRPLRCQS